MADPELPPGYPAGAEADVVLRDGSVSRVRPIVPSDGDLIRAFHAQQSEESIYLRFFAPLRELSAKDIHRFTHVDYVDRMALVALVHDEIVGIGRYDRVSPSSAEVAFNVSDHHHGKGIGSVMLEHLAAIAQEHGITRFEAEVLPQNRKMLGVFSDAGYEVSRRFEDGVVMVHFDIEPTEQSQSVRLAREHRAEAASIQSLLHPASVAVVGASRTLGTIGYSLLAHIVDSGFTGTVHAVNPSGGTIAGIEAVARLSDIDEPVDLAVVAVPAPAVLDVVEEAARTGVRSLLVISSGFAEAGEEGRRLQDRLLRTAREHGMRVVGPNSFGVANTDPGVRLNATLAPQLPPVGHFGLFSQSGALGVAVLASAASRNLGISVFASAGNRVDVSGNDVMQYWIDDDATSAVGLYLESMGNPRKFSRIARNLAVTKPVIVVRSGVSSFGAPPGHRVRPTKARPAAFASMLRQAGVIRVENVHQMLDVAQLVVHQPLPRGPRVAVVGNSSQLGALTADACVSWGLQVVHGPVSLSTVASAAAFRDALAAAVADESVDCIVACFIPPIGALDEEVLDAVRQTAATTDKTFVATLLGLRGVDPGRDASETGAVPGMRSTDLLTERPGEDSASPREAIPLYPMPEDAVRALSAAVGYGLWREKDKGTPVVVHDVDRAAARAVVERVLGDDPEGRVLTVDETGELLAAYGISLWPVREAGSADEAVAVADELGYPVVVKSLSPLVRGHSVLEGIRVDLDTPEDVHRAFTTLDARLAPIDANHFVVQRMAPAGVACVLTGDEDPLFGPVVSFGLAGAATELLGDIAYRIPPMTDVDVRELITSIKAAPLLQGHRGSEPVDLEAVADVVARVSQMSDDLPELASVTLNPLVAHARGCEVLGATAVLAAVERRTDPGRRTLT